MTSTLPQVTPDYPLGPGQGGEGPPGLAPLPAAITPLMAEQVRQLAEALRAANHKKKRKRNPLQRKRDRERADLALWNLEPHAARVAAAAGTENGASHSKPVLPLALIRV